MAFLVTIRIAVRALAKNKMRAGLTILGIVIGIAAVTTMVSIGQSAGKMIQGQFESLGTNVIVIMPGSRERGGVQQSGMPTLTSKDVDAIDEECKSVMAVSALIRSNGQIIYRNVNWSPKELWGVSTGYLTVRNWGLRFGNFFSEKDVTSATKVCVLGQTIAEKLFQTVDPINETIRIKNIPFRVIGVLEEKGANLVGDDQDDIILMPYTTVRKRLFGSGFDNVHAIMVSARSIDRMAEATREIEQLLYERHKIAPDEKADFQVQNTTEIANILGIITGTMTMLLSSIAGISLLVGGVGIMNIMLVSVTERTREIGIRMAVGAKSKDILRQFLVESVLLSCIGGFIGFVLGVIASISITRLISSLTSGSSWPVVISLPAAGIAVLFAAAVGMFFGYYPARQASQLDPIDALRYE